MKVKKIIIIALLATFTRVTFGQETIPVSGGGVTGTDGSFSFTLGQPFAQSDFEPAVSANIVTASVIEGVQQPFTIDQLSIDEATTLTESVRIYPNPTKNHVVVEMNNVQTIVDYKLYGLEGRLLQSGTLQERVSLDLSEYASGTYLLYLGDGQKKNVYRIIKVN